MSQDCINKCVSLYLVHEKVSRDPGSGFVVFMTVFKVKGSKGNIYKITKEGDNYKCECKSFYYNRYTCKHIENIKQNLRNKNRTDMDYESSKKKKCLMTLKLN